VSGAGRAAVLRQVVERALRGSIDLAAVTTDDLVTWTPNLLTRTRAELVEALRPRDDVLADLEISFETVDVTGVRGVVEWTARATFAFPLLLDEDLLIEPTGARVVLAGATIAEFRGSQVCALRFYFDDAALLEQMLDS
jgi:hypothetical protein